MPGEKRKKRVLIVFGTDWDRRQLEACRADWAEDCEVEFADPVDAECPWALDIEQWIADQAARARRRIDGVFSSSDYPGAAAAAALAAELGLPGTPPAALLCTAHKFYAREIERAVVPECVPAYALVLPDDRSTWDPPFGFPCFVKPVKGAFSILARRVANRAELEELLTSAPTAYFLDTWMRIFDALVRRYTDFAHAGRCFLAEELTLGEQVTVEGYCAGSEVRVLGVVDSTFHAGSASFARFDYPSALPAELQRRMVDVTRRAVAALGLRDVFFNAELVWDERAGRLYLVEVNPRIAGQFSDLYQKVDGVHAYALALALATGAALPARGAGRHAVAASFPLRIFEPARVRRAPTAADVAAAEALFPGTQVWIECATGDELSDFAAREDGVSLRYAIVNLGAGSRAEATERLAAVRARLGFELEPL